MGLSPRAVIERRLLRRVARRLANLRDEAASLGDAVLTMMIANAWQEAVSRRLRSTLESGAVKLIPSRPTESGFRVAGAHRVASDAMHLAGRVVMSADDFCAWQAFMGWTDTQTAKQLQINRNTVTRYKGRGAPLHIALAANALASGLAPWRAFGGYIA
jgi:hypothetical protein